MFHTGRELCGLSTLATPYCGKNRPKNRPKNSPKNSPIVEWSKSPIVQSMFYPVPFRVIALTLTTVDQLLPLL